jgi:hypothetical protein
VPFKSHDAGAAGLNHLDLGPAAQSQFVQAMDRFAPADYVRYGRDLARF